MFGVTSLFQTANITGKKTVVERTLIFLASIRLTIPGFIQAATLFSINPDQNLATDINFNNSQPVSDRQWHGSTNFYVANGNVGIGTTSPQAQLHSFGTGNIAPNTTYNGSAAQIFNSGLEDLAFGIDNASPWSYLLQARTSSSGAGVLTLNPLGGYVGIGTRSPGYSLDVNGTIRMSGAGLYNSSGYQIVQGNASDWLRINQGNSYASGTALYGDLALGTGGLCRRHLFRYTPTGELYVTGSVGSGQRRRSKS